uniref:Uncharacterized protein n=1 Tax=Conchiformibius kuhniae TaxID=211502 RepID=A0A8T9MYJ1_9NEIS|nr:hypothetical protein LVJ77_04840 [Conchiformibius kuhniae]
MSASEVAAAASAASAALSVDAENNLALPALAPACERYFRRAEQCFSQNENRDALLAMLDEAREELAHEQPDEAACTDLNRSFDAVARNLGCH